jgi:general stress protein 26
MASKEHSNAELEVRLWDEIGKGRTGMLGLTGGEADQCFQPMTAFAEPRDQTIWFFTRGDIDLAKRVGPAGADAMFIFQSKDQKVQACLAGRVSAQRDGERIDKYWNPVVAAWYPQGKDDPALVLLRFNVMDAELWLSDVGPAKFAWEIVKANATGKQPDLGESASLRMAR